MDSIRKRISTMMSPDHYGIQRQRSASLGSIGQLGSKSIDIGAPTDFKHNVNVRLGDNGTFVGMPEEWLTLLLKQVATDRENGDLDAAADGARVLRFFQEFSRDNRLVFSVNLN